MDGDVSAAEVAAAQVELVRILPRVVALLERPAQAEERGWHSVESAAAKLDMTPDAVRGAIKSGHLRADRTTSGRRRIHDDDLTAFATGGAAT